MQDLRIHIGDLLADFPWFNARIDDIKAGPCNGVHAFPCPLVVKELHPSE
jgi:hypothetical protein